MSSVTTTTGANLGSLEAECHRRHKMLHRVRYGEFVLVEQHIHSESLLVFERANGASRLLAGGLRFAISPTPIPEPLPESGRSSYEPRLDSGWTLGWMDPASEPHPLERPREVFADLSELPVFVEGVAGLAKTGGVWRRTEHDSRYAGAEEYEAVFTWDGSLSFRLVKRGLTQALIVESGALGFIVSDERLYSAARWMRGSCESLMELTSRIGQEQER